MSGGKYRPREHQPPPVGLLNERCYCERLDLPYVHTLGDHRVTGTGEGVRPR